MKQPYSYIQSLKEEREKEENDSIPDKREHEKWRKWECQIPHDPVQ